VLPYKVNSDLRNLPSSLKVLHVFVGRKRMKEDHYNGHSELLSVISFGRT
jgi:hypothetical protein